MADMNKGVQGALLRLLHAEEFRLRVTSTMLECGGLMKRITFASPDEMPEALFEPATWIRLWFRTANGRKVQRAYTVAGYAADHSTIDVSFYLHQTSGPAASWAQRVRSGAMLDVSLLGSKSFHLDDRARGVVLMGDETAFPALRAIITSLPDNIETRVLLTGEHDLSTFIPARPHVDVRYAPTQRAVRTFERLLRDLPGMRATGRDVAIDAGAGAAGGAAGGAGLADSADGGIVTRGAAHGSDTSAVTGLWHCWAAGESSMMRAVRAAARHSDTVVPHGPSTQSYWSRHRII